MNELGELKQWLSASKEQTAHLAIERDEQVRLIGELQSDATELRSLVEGEQTERKEVPPLPLSACRHLVDQL
jgi:hypothetical protein